MKHLPSLDGWLSWSMDNEKYSLRTNKDQIYKFHVDIKNLPLVDNHYQSLYSNAELMRDYYSGTFDVLLSGGIDSEVVVRVFKDLGINHNTYIFRYKKDYNFRDVESAIEICKSLHIPYKVIDFDLEKFYEQEAYDFFKKSGCLSAGRLTHMKFFDYLDGIPITGESEPYWKRVNGADYSKKSEWKFCFGENFHNTSMYATSLGREHVVDWYEFSPNVIKTFIDLPQVQQLLNDMEPGKTSTWSSRVSIYREIWPDIKPKVKLIGFESQEGPGSYPEFMIPLQEIITNELGRGQEFWLSYDEFVSLFQ
jgi:hypothetical protein